MMRMDLKGDDIVVSQEENGENEVRGNGGEGVAVVDDVEETDEGYTEEIDKVEDDRLLFHARSHPLVPPPLVLDKGASSWEAIQRLGGC